MSRRTGSDFGGHTPAGPKVFRAKIQGQRNKLAKPPATETRRGAGGTGHSPSATYLFPAILDRLALDIYPRRPCTNRGDSRLVRCLRLVDTPPRNTNLLRRKRAAVGSDREARFAPHCGTSCRFAERSIMVLC